jgi:hypothetical protein
MTFTAAKKIKQTSEPVVAPVAPPPVPAPVAKPKRVKVKQVVAPVPEPVVEEDTEEEIEEEEEEEAEGALEETEEDDDFDKFELKTGGVFNKDEVLRIELPKFMIKNDIKNLYVVEDKSTVVVTLAANESNQNIGKRVFGAIKNGFREFKIEFHDTFGDVSSVWDFKGAKLRTVDFGALESKERVEPRTIMCEIEYDDLVIDKEGFI